MNAVKIHIPTKEENDAALAEFFKRENRVTQERTKAAVLAQPALKRLAKVLCERSGQPYKIRALLYSLWNGKPVELNETLGLDWELKQDICAVILAFGFEGNGVRFFYDALEKEVREVRQWDWFLEERFEWKKLAEWADSCRRQE